MVIVRWLAALTLAGGAIGACTLIDSDPPQNTCKTDPDCFRAQGEYCSARTHTCVAGDARLVDAGVDVRVDAP